MKNLQTLTVKELKVIAKENGIALSYTQDGKRHTLNKPELINAIEVKQLEATNIKTVEMVNELLDNVNNVKSNDDAPEIEKLSISEVIPFATSKLKSIQCINELIEFKNKLFASFNDKQTTRKRTLKSKWALQYNRLTMLFKQYEMKLA